MPILIDTHVLVWAVADSRRLSARARSCLTVPGQQLLVSAVTAWEYGDLYQRGRLDRAGPLDDVLHALSIEVIALPAELWRLASSLPPIHLDPMDRMLIAHAVHADLTLVTADADIRRYPVRTIW